ncbi:hypothetical protein ACFWX4_41675, partial [Streptomyces sp. NPDC059063]
MTDGRNNRNHGNGTSGGWEPIPQGEYDADATAFVQLPEGAADAVSTPLAAPGHGYVPPQITVTPTAPDATDPAATGVWVLPPEVTGIAPVTDGTQAVSWPDPAAQAGPGAPDGYDPRATGQWTFPDAITPEPGGGHAPAPAPAAHDVTGQWSIPVADGDLPDESGEFTTSSLAAHWGGTPPATLPGGAPAPWATTWPTQPAAEPLPMEQPPAAQPPTAQPSAAQPPAAQPPVEQPSVEETPFERTAKLFVVAQRPDGSLAPVQRRDEAAEPGTGGAGGAGADAFAPRAGDSGAFAMEAGAGAVAPEAAEANAFAPDAAGVDAFAPRAGDSGAFVTGVGGPASQDDEAGADAP